MILAVPKVVTGDSEYPNMFNRKGRVLVLGAQLGTIVPNPYQLTLRGGPARFSYRADKTGSETLRFTAEMGRVVRFEEFDADGSRKEALVQSANDTFKFEVRECTYKVKFVYHWQMPGAEQFGFMGDTWLKRQKDGTFAGNGDFIVSSFASSPGCKANISDFEPPIGLTGKLLKDSNEPELAIKYGKATMKFLASCGDAGSGGGSETVDSTIPGLQNPKFPQRGVASHSRCLGLEN